MQMKFFGDSYDIVKRSLLCWLRVFGKWSIHPMFTEEDVSSVQIKAYEALLGAKVISHEVLRPDSDRAAYFEGACSYGHLFLDPDTGLRLEKKRGGRGPRYLFYEDLQRLSERRPDSLTMVFDQSLSHGSSAIEQLEEKLHQLGCVGVFGFAYVSHACFLVVGGDRSLVGRARKRVIFKSKLPEERFLAVHDE